MARPQVSEEGGKLETWEIAIPGTLYVWRFDKREDRYTKVRVSGRIGSSRLHISHDDRRYNQEQIPFENKALDPFTNGSLRLIDADATSDVDVRNHFTAEQLIAMFEVRDEEVFASEIEDIDSQVVLNRLMELADKHGTLAQNTILKDSIRRRWPIGGTQATVREMIQEGDRIGAIHI